MVKILVTMGAMLMWISGAVSAAVVTTFTDEATYTSSVGSEVFLLNFDGLVSLGDTGVFPGQVDFNSPEAINPDLVNLNTFVGDTGSTVASNNVGPIEGVLAAPAFAVGMDILSGLISGIDLYDAASNLVESVSIAASGFVGLSSDTAFSRFIVRNGVFPTGGNDRVFIDNFRVNNLATVPVPVPATLALLGFGFAGIGYQRRKQTKAA